MLKTISFSIGGIVSYETLTINSGLKYNEVREILPLLEDSFVIFIVKPFYKNLINELRKNPKIYFIDYGIRNYLMENFENIEYGGLYENFVHNELKRSYAVKYWRTTAKTEVDFIVEHKNNIIPIEVKIKPKITRSFRSFVQHYAPNRAFLLNESMAEKKSINKCDIFIIPFVYF